MQKNPTIAAALLAASMAASAFERDGFTSGAPRDAVTKGLLERGYHVGNALSHPDRKRILFVTFSHPTAKHAGTLSYCDGRLHGYAPSQSLKPPKFNTFLELLNDLTARHGPGIYSTLGGPKEDPRPYALRFLWNLKDEVIRLDYLTMGPLDSHFSIAYFDQLDCPDL